MNIIIKPIQKKDFYILWSLKMQKPLMWGTKRKFKKWAKDPALRTLLGVDYMSKIIRADMKSCSDESYLWYNWEVDFSLNYGNQGTLYRSDLFDVIKILSKKKSSETDPRIFKYVIPFGD